MYEISKYEFEKWVNTLNTEALSEYEITMINCILDNYELISSCGTAGGVRAKNIGKIIAGQGNKTQKTLHISGITKNINRTVSKILELQVEHFRGFGAQQEFKFDKQYTFFHGPNGSGKTSFCEALEYSLLGSIEEATTRSIPIEKYIVHAGEKKAIKPSLKCIYDDGVTDECVSDFEKYRFSFIEKNRINNFSHIGAANAKSQTERIAALFGLSEFQEFIKGFTAEIDKKYIKIESNKEELYSKESTRIEEMKKYLEEAKGVSDIPKRELEKIIISMNNPKVIDAESAIQYLEDKDNGIIARLTKEMKDNQVLLIDEKQILKLKSECMTFIKAFERIEQANADILSDVKSLNLKVLYDAVLNLDEKEKIESCPVCLTPLSKTKVNPFEYAREEINKFVKIEAAKQTIEENVRIIVEKYNDIKRILDCKEIKEILHEINYVNFQKELLLTNDVEELTLEVRNIKKEIEKGFAILVNEQSIDNRIKIHNEKAEKINKKYEDELNNAKSVDKKLVELKAKIEASEQNEKKWKDDLEESLPKLQLLKTEIDEEKVEIDFNKNMVQAYRQIVKNLNEYIITLPIKMSENLSDKIKTYYNDINVGDADFEIIEDLRLPISSNEKIMIKMKDGAEQDALQILSEGHVKILGLSILLAKAKVENATFLIFDDVVNAIDDEHREGVAQLLITNKDFENVQMILTCHGEIFVSFLADYVEDKKSMSRYMFLPADSLNERGIVIKYQDSTIPLKVAREKYVEGNMRDSLSKCRQAVECISGRLWNKVISSSDGISIKMRKLNGKPDLYNVMCALKTVISKIEGIGELQLDLETLLKDKNWTLLNKGTHIDNEIPEFSRLQVKELLELLEKIAKEVNDLKVIAKVKEKNV